MTLTLQNMESNEYKRMNSMRDAFINWSAFTTNYCASRSYDISDLANSMSLINIENDLQIFMKHTIEQTAQNIINYKYNKNKNINPKHIKQHTKTIINNNTYYMVPQKPKQLSTFNSSLGSTDYLYNIKYDNYN